MNFTPELSQLIRGVALPLEAPSAWRNMNFAARQRSPDIPINPYQSISIHINPYQSISIHINPSISHQRLRGQHPIPSQYTHRFCHVNAVDAFDVYSCHPWLEKLSLTGSTVLGEGWQGSFAVALSSTNLLGRDDSRQHFGMCAHHPWCSNDTVPVQCSSLACSLTMYDIARCSYPLLMMGRSQEICHSACPVVIAWEGAKRRNQHLIVSLSLAPSGPTLAFEV